MKKYTKEEITKIVGFMYNNRWSVGKDYFEAAYNLLALLDEMEDSTMEDVFNKYMEMNRDDDQYFL